MNIAQVARIAHEVDRAYLSGVGLDAGEPWDKSSCAARENMVMSVKAMSRGFVTAKSTHDAWMKEMVRNGWRYGKRENIADKTHPNLREYAELPSEVRSRDSIFAAVVRGALGLPGEPEVAPDDSSVH